MEHSRKDAYGAGQELMKQLRDDHEMVELLGEAVWASRTWEVAARSHTDCEVVDNAGKKIHKLEAHKNVFWHRMNVFKDHLNAVLTNEARKWGYEQEDKT